MQLKRIKSRNTRSNGHGRCAMILAGGDGTRLKALTRAISGDERPKQFCPILNNDTLLVQTRKRIRQNFKPENTYYILTKDHEKFYQPLLLDVSRQRKIIQSRNKGTAPAILVGLLKLPIDATVAFFPSDHYISDKKSFMKHIKRAFKTAELPGHPIVLVGIKPECPETSYGWIEPIGSPFGTAKGEISKVRRFWEKPTADIADKLFKRGCLWNSFVMIGKVGKFLEMIKRTLPDLYDEIEPLKAFFGTDIENVLLEEAYEKIEETNFSNKVLEGCADELYVVNAGDVGWSDWGEPQRVFGSLERLGIKTDWMLAMA
ncbi:MAG: hypothetical protein KDB79_15625 [Acidobacteria bacterium]|nr:hypothetical protein [Acidobacteriota bacterium]